MTIDEAELDAWLRLLGTPGIGRVAARRLLAAFGSPQAAVQCSVAARAEVIGANAARALSELPEGHAKQLRSTLEWLGQQDGASRQVVTLGDAGYPPALLETADPPVLLYARGDVSLLHAPSVAIVGSRNPTAQGRDNARAFARHLSRAGWTVVSGLALGIDGAAHEGALEGGGRTVAVVGTGIDRVYPARHRELAHRIAEQGLIISEYPLGTEPLPSNFPPRNRIIAGLSRATLVVEAAVQSGSLITARLAAEAGREVFALPGSIHSPQARGCHALIKQGAKLVETAADILDELAPTATGGAATSKPGVAQGSATTTDDALLAALGFDPVTLDALVARTGWPAAELGAKLLELELDGHVARLPGQLFQRRAAS
jgi:DNA processing protein